MSPSEFMHPKDAATSHQLMYFGVPSAIISVFVEEESFRMA